MLAIEIVYALSHEQIIFTVKVKEGSSVLEAIQQSEILKHYPNLDLQQHQVGIFSTLVNLDHIVQEGDRIEIYRPLTIDPKTARRQRATKKK